MPVTVLVSTISNSQVFLLKKYEYSHFFSKNISLHAIFNDQNFNDTLNNDIVSFEQLGPGFRKLIHRDFNPAFSEKMLDIFHMNCQLGIK